MLCCKEDETDIHDTPIILDQFYSRRPQEFVYYWSLVMLHLNSSYTWLLASRGRC